MKRGWKPVPPDPGPWGEDILTSDHHRGCAGREYACTCGYDAAVLAEVVRLRAEIAQLTMRVAVMAKIIRAEAPD